MLRQRLPTLLAVCIMGLGYSVILMAAKPSIEIGLLDQSNYSDRVLNDWERISSILENIITIIALALGAMVGYFKFIKGRVYRPRIEPAVTGRIEKLNGLTMLVVHSEAKNVGNSKISLGPSSGLDIFFDGVRLFPKGGQPLSIATVKWQEPISFRVFRDHHWVESGETIREEQMFSLSSPDLTAVKVALHLEVGRVTVTSMKIVALTEAPPEKRPKKGE
jgi:hypothetical protein